MIKVKEYLKSHIRRKTWWASNISAFILVAQAIGFNTSNIIPSNYMDILNALFGLATLFGISVDTTSKATD